MSLIRYEYFYCEFAPGKLGCVPTKRKECEGRETCTGCPHYKYRKEEN